MIGIIGAQIEEIQAFLEKMIVKKEVELHNKIYYYGLLGSKEVVLTLCGIGKVAAANTTTILLDHFPIDWVVNVGTAGGIKGKVSPKNVLIAYCLAYSDADLTFFEHYQYGQMAGCPRYFESDKALVNKFYEYDNSFVKGTIISGDQFAYKAETINKTIDRFVDGNIYAVDMESAAVAHVCYLMQKKFIVLRYISDIIGEVNQEENYEANLLLSSHRLADIIIGNIEE